MLSDVFEGIEEGPTFAVAVVGFALGIVMTGLLSFFLSYSGDGPLHLCVANCMAAGSSQRPPPQPVTDRNVPPAAQYPLGPANPPNEPKGIYVDGTRPQPPPYNVA